MDFVSEFNLQVRGDWHRSFGLKGDQPGQFCYPHFLALTPDEVFLLVADRDNHRVAVLRASDGTWVRQLTGTPGSLQHLSAVAVVPSTGEVLVADGIWAVYRFRSIEDDTVIGALGDGTQGNGPTSLFVPYGLAVLDGPNCTSVWVFLLLCFLFFSLFLS